MTILPSDDESWHLSGRLIEPDTAMINKQPDNDNNPVVWWERFVPLLLRGVILVITVRATLRAFS